MYKRYVDIFCIFGNKKDAEIFFEFFHCYHKNIKFTIEKESNKFLSFLHILIKMKETVFQHQFIKRKHKLGCLQFHSFTPMSYKILYTELLKLVVYTLYFITNWKRLRFYYRKTCTLKALLIIKLKPF